MQKELTDLQPELIKTSAETDKMMIKIEEETVEVDAKRELVAADEAVANEAAAAAQEIKDECEGDLAEAMPALEAAVAALDTLKPADITVVKTMQNPPGPIKLVMESICVIKGIKPERKPDPTGSGYMVTNFVDDTKIGSIIDSEEGYLRLQRDHDQLGQWAKEWKMEFNLDKYE
eukprot:g32632.t1